MFELLKLAFPKSPRILCFDRKLIGHSREAALHYIWGKSV